MANYDKLDWFVGTAAQVASDNPVLGIKQAFRETDTNRVKLGDGVTQYNSRPYLGQNYVPGGAYKWAALGDSITNMNHGPTQYQRNGRGPLVWTESFLRGRAVIPDENILGYSGQTTSVILSHLPDLLKLTCDGVILGGGINDIGQNVLPATTQANDKALIDGILAAGKSLVVCTTSAGTNTIGAPITAAVASGATSLTVALASIFVGHVLKVTDGTNADTVTVTAVDAANKIATFTPALTHAYAAGVTAYNLTLAEYQIQNNDYRRNYCRTLGVPIADWFAVSADPATGLPIPNTYTAGTVQVYPGMVDGVHPGKDMAILYGRETASAMESLIPPSNPPTAEQTNIDQRNVIVNPLLIGGTTVATGWSIIGSTGFTAVGSKLPRDDGHPGEMQRIVVGPGNTGANVDLTQVVTGLTFDGETKYEAWCDFRGGDDLKPLEISGATASFPIHFYVQYKDSSGNILLVGDANFVASSDSVQATYWPAQGRLRVPPHVPPTTAVRAEIYIVMGGVDTGTLDILDVAFRKAID